MVPKRQRDRVRGPAGETAPDQTYAAVIKLSGPWWIGRIEEVPGVTCQERSRAELLETLEVTLREALEMNRREALDAAGDTFEEAPIAV
jgi:predicted RNase H-like HicB family nuclease